MEETKYCRWCEQDRSIDEFYKHPQMKGGRVNKCTTCCKDAMHEVYKENKPHYAAYEKARGSTDKRKAQAIVYQKTRRAKNDGKDKARQLVNFEIQMGRLERQPCEVCQEPDAEAHHDDYSKPLDIRWLCFKHHREHHGQKVAVN